MYAKLRSTVKPETSNHIVYIGMNTYIQIYVSFNTGELLIRVVDNGEPATPTCTLEEDTIKELRKSFSILLKKSKKVSKFRDKLRK